VIRRLGSLTRRQLLVVGVVAALAVAIGVAAVLGRAAITAALVGLLVVLVFAAALQLRRRVSELERMTRLLLEQTQSLTAANTHLADRVEFGQRRVVAAVEKERLAAADRHQKALSAIRSSRERLIRSGRDQTSEVEALLQLYRDLQPRAAMPLSGHWALDATGLLELVFLLNTGAPKLVVELGSGTSSVWIAYAMERIGGRLISVDHDRAYAEQTRWLLSAHGLEKVAEVRDAPLCSLDLEGEGFQWYDPAVFEDVRDIDLLMVDGPPRASGEDARYPALRVLEPRLSPTAVVVLDDADRSDEQHIVERWLKTVNGLTRDHAMLGRQAVLNYHRGSGG
jgi:predicted O-methyltransferase YrrM